MPRQKSNQGIKWCVISEPNAFLRLNLKLHCMQTFWTIFEQVGIFLRHIIVSVLSCLLFILQYRQWEKKHLICSC